MFIYKLSKLLPFNIINKLCLISNFIFKIFVEHVSFCLCFFSEESYTVIDYALRDQIRVESCHPEELNLSPVHATTGMLTSRQNVASHLFKIRFRSNHSGDDVSMILGAELL